MERTKFFTPSNCKCLMFRFRRLHADRRGDPNSAEFGAGLQPDGVGAALPVGARAGVGVGARGGRGAAAERRAAAHRALRHRRERAAGAGACLPSLSPSPPSVTISIA